MRQNPWVQQGPWRNARERIVQAARSDKKADCHRTYGTLIGAKVSVNGPRAGIRVFFHKVGMILCKAFVHRGLQAKEKIKNS